MVHRDVPRRAWTWFLLALVVLLTATAVLVVVTTDPQDGANIGVGLVLVPLIGLGLPWSLPVVVDPDRFDELSVAAQAAFDLGPPTSTWRCTRSFVVDRRRSHRSPPT